MRPCTTSVKNNHIITLGTWRNTHMSEEVFDLHQGWNSLTAEVLYAEGAGGPPRG
jgi:hypothetical protein